LQSVRPEDYAGNKKPVRVYGESEVKKGETEKKQGKTGGGVRG